MINGLTRDSRMKICKKCGQLKPLSEYYTRNQGLYIKSTCKSCDSEKAKQAQKMIEDGTIDRGMEQ